MYEKEGIRKHTTEHEDKVQECNLTETYDFLYLSLNGKNDEFIQKSLCIMISPGFFQCV